MSGAQLTCKQNQRGLTLLEMIASLAIVSLVSAALFQSMGAWMRLSSRASAAAEQSLSEIADQIMFDRVVGGIVFAWPEQSDLHFTGSPIGFSGLSKSALESTAPQLKAVQFLIARDPSGGRLVYLTKDVEWTMAEFGPASEAQFSYLGADGVWRPSWPPAENPEPGPFDDARFFPTPQTPLAVRLTVTDGSDSETWIADISSHPRIPQRIQDLQ